MFSNQLLGWPVISWKLLIFNFQNFQIKKKLDILNSSLFCCNSTDKKVWSFVLCSMTVLKDNKWTFSRQVSMSVVWHIWPYLGICKIYITMKQMKRTDSLRVGGSPAPWHWLDDSRVISREFPLPVIWQDAVPAL